MKLADYLQCEGVTLEHLGLGREGDGVIDLRRRGHGARRNLRD